MILNKRLILKREEALGVEIKGITVPALMIKLDENISIDENINQIEKKLSNAFFKGSIAIIDTGNMKIDEENRKKIEKIVEKHNSSVIGYKKSVKSEEKADLPEINEKKSLKIINRTVRSGQRVEYDGDILIIGDVNPDAYVISSGNVIVMGALRGFVHAGANGDETAVVLALKLMPQQLRIANYLTRSPDDTEEPDYPEKAYIEDGKIIIEKI